MTRISIPITTARLLPSTLAASLILRCLAWRRRCKTLRRLDDDQLRDIGLTRDDIARACIFHWRKQ